MYTVLPTFSDEQLADAYGIAVEAYNEDTMLPKRERVFYADQAAAICLNVPVHVASRLMRPAPVTRSETPIEQRFRQYDQVPTMRRHLVLTRLDRRPGGVSSVLRCTINADLKPGKAKYIKRITMPSAFAVSPHTAGR